MLPGYEIIKGNSAGSYTDGGWKLVLHTTEGSSIAGAVGAYKKNNSWPHFTLSFEEDRKVQHLEVGVAARSLANDTSDGFQVGRARCIQVEICGFAGESQDWKKTKLDWLADRFKEIRAVQSFGFSHPAFTVPAVRMSDKEWVDFGGIVGHQHAPDNDHWDPGRLDVGYIVERMKGVPVPPVELGESKILGVNYIGGDMASVWGQIACNVHGCGLWRFNVDGWPSTIPNGSPVFRGPRFDVTGTVPIFSVPPEYGSAELSIDVDGNGVIVTLTGAPSAAVFQMWVPVAKGK